MGSQNDIHVHGKKVVHFLCELRPCIVPRFKEDILKRILPCYTLINYTIMSEIKLFVKELELKVYVKALHACG